MKIPLPFKIQTLVPADCENKSRLMKVSILGTHYEASSVQRIPFERTSLWTRSCSMNISVKFQ